MTALAPTLQLFFTERLARQRQASPCTVTSYRNTFRLLLRFIQQRTGKAPSSLDWADLSAGTISAFLDHLEDSRGNSARSRNARLAALRSLFRYAALRHPEHAQLIQQVLAIPQKRFDRALVSFLTPAETRALLAAPDPGRWEGRRDRALLILAAQTGLRLAELTGLNCNDVQLSAPAHVRCTGKGRKQRCVPLTPATAAVIRTWLRERGNHPGEPLFPARTGRRLSDDAVERRVALHAHSARQRCPSLTGKNVTPHTLRHTAAMSLLHAGVDTTVIALWLGHADPRSTEPYLHADMTIKERALARTTPPSVKPGRYHPPDSLLAFLENLGLSRPRPAPRHPPPPHPATATPGIRIIPDSG
jgi:site-specific recombinase XerD